MSEKGNADLAWDDDVPEVATTTVTPPAVSISASIAPAPRVSTGPGGSRPPDRSALQGGSALGASERPLGTAPAAKLGLPAIPRSTPPSVAPAAGSLTVPRASTAKPGSTPPSAAVALAVGRQSWTTPLPSGVPAAPAGRGTGDPPVASRLEANEVLTEGTQAGVVEQAEPAASAVAVAGGPEQVEQAASAAVVGRGLELPAAASGTAEVAQASLTANDATLEEAEVAPPSEDRSRTTAGEAVSQAPAPSSVGAPVSEQPAVAALPSGHSEAPSTESDAAPLEASPAGEAPTESLLSAASEQGDAGPSRPFDGVGGERETSSLNAAIPSTSGEPAEASRPGAEQRAEPEPGPDDVGPPQEAPGATAANIDFAEPAKNGSNAASGAEGEVVATFRPTETSALDALVTAPKPRRAGSVVAVLAALGVLGAAVWMAWASVTDEEGRGGTGVAAEPPPAAGEAIPSQDMPADGRTASGRASPTENGTADDRLPGAFASALKGPQQEPEHGAEELAPEGTSAAAATDSQRRESSGTPPRAGVATVTIRTVPDDADIYNHRGRRVGIGTAQTEVEPRAKYTFTILRHAYKPRKLLVDGSEPEMVIELERAFPKK